MPKGSEQSLSLNYEELFRMLPERYVVLRADDPDFTFVDVNEPEGIHFSKRRSDLVGKRFFDVYPDNSPKFKETGVSDLAESLRKVIRTKKPSILDAFRYDVQDGKGRFVPKYWRSRYYPLLDKSGNVAYIVATQVDVTAEMLPEQKLVGVKGGFKGLAGSVSQLVMYRIRHLMEVRASKDEFIALASHELRTPASAVKQYLGMLMDGFAGPVPEELLPFIQTAFESNERQIKIINDILLVAQLDLQKLMIHKEPVDMAKKVANVIKDIPRLTNRESPVVFEKPGEPIMVSADRMYLRMALSNIVENAAKYTPDDKPITISIKKVDDDYVDVVVKDHGVGIAAEDLRKLFKKFSRIQNPLSVEVGGTGLGLYWAREIIGLHDGSILVESELGKGSVFTVRLPLYRP